MALAALAAAGSSPLARGLPPHGNCPCRRPRIIPARAGFTSFPYGTEGGTGDHPRSRGVYETSGSLRESTNGSSPLARGLQGDLVVLEVVEGIIPARAGFTRSAPESSPRSRDHPRSRGVYQHGQQPAQPAAGSSPLARGLLRRPLPQSKSHRIIPARAGFTLPPVSVRWPRWDHPRSRGVYPWRPHERGPRRGSSPLARGLPPGNMIRKPLFGIIPARAGFTRRRTGVTTEARDHPRSRGVYETSGSLRESPSGSSPLARGLLGPGPVDHRSGRIIPARAGFTRCGVHLAW